MSLTGVVLPDINIWIAYVMTGHPQHRKVGQLWASLQNAQLAVCRVTQMGFLRLLTNPMAMGGEVQNPAAAWNVYRALCKEQELIFLSESPGLEQIWNQFTSTPDFPRKHWTDSYLAAFAASANVALLTLDRGMRRFTGVNVEIWH